MSFTNQKSHDLAKEAAGLAAVRFIQSGMTVGLGTGSTAAHFIRGLIEECRKGLKVRAVSSSLNSEKMAKKGGIPVIGIDEVSEIDITVDGADEIDPSKRMIKGGGGALLREKIVASASKEMIVIVDESKLVQTLGTHMPLPVEVAPFGKEITLRKIASLGSKPVIRKTKKGDFFYTDNGNIIIDITFDKPLNKPEETETKLIGIPGVLDTGFFFGLAGRVIVGHLNGEVQIRE